MVREKSFLQILVTFLVNSNRSDSFQLPNPFPLLPRLTDVCSGSTNTDRARTDYHTNKDLLIKQKIFYDRRAPTFIKHSAKRIQNPFCLSSDMIHDSHTNILRCVDVLFCFLWDFSISLQQCLWDAYGDPLVLQPLPEAVEFHVISKYLTSYLLLGGYSFCNLFTPRHCVTLKTWKQFRLLSTVRQNVIRNYDWTIDDGSCCCDFRVKGNKILRISKYWTMLHISVVSP